MSRYILGVIIPASVFILSFIMTHLLYKHFSKDRDT